jgi:UDP:flavonoid glycosyltransferase YjiC (YdhE family)
VLLAPQIHRKARLVISSSWTDSREQDLQPFLKIGQILRDKFNHRVRIASHPAFKSFVEKEMGLEYFCVGGDPAELMAFMVKNPGLIPSIETVKAGEIGRRRESMYEMFQGFWRACINATDDETDVENLKMMGQKAPFVADAIIANPPSFAHYHCAEKLGIPLHLVFTFPYSPTQAFPHPLASIKPSNVDQRYTNFMSYPLVELLVWQGFGDLVNRFRVQTLGLPPVSALWAPGQLSRLKVPMTYLWSPGLVPKPQDWGPEIEIAGYVFLDLASTYTPPQDLAGFLVRSDAKPLIYIGFGSISGIDDPAGFTRMVFEAVEKAGVRAVVSRGWGGMGDGMDKTDNIFLVDNVPHDWLFPQLDAVVHHGGAGTTAAGLRFGKPTMIVPFFGDQPFWGNMVGRAGAGAKEALPLKKLDADKLAEGIRQCLEHGAKARAQEIADSIRAEGDGAENVVGSFHRALNLEAGNSMRCSIFPDRIAVWSIRYSSTRLSALAAEILVESKQLDWADLELVRHREWTDFSGPGEPITGAGSAVVQAFREACHGISEIHDTTKRNIKLRDKRKSANKEKSLAAGLVFPGRIALATRGTSLEEQRRKHHQLVREVNFHGQAQPSKLYRTESSLSNEPSPTVAVVRDVGRGLGHSSKAIAALPFQMWNAVAIGFHNAPRLCQSAHPGPGNFHFH